MNTKSRKGCVKDMRACVVKDVELQRSLTHIIFSPFISSCHATHTQGVPHTQITPTW